MTPEQDTERAAEARRALKLAEWCGERVFRTSDDELVFRALHVYAAVIWPNPAFIEQTRLEATVAAINACDGHSAESAVHAVLAALRAVATEAPQGAERCPECGARRGADTHAPGYSCDYYTRAAPAPDASREPQR